MHDVYDAFFDVFFPSKLSWFANVCKVQSRALYEDQMDAAEKKKQIARK